MSESKHTPDPWIILGEDELSRIKFIEIATPPGPGYRPIAWVVCDPEVDAITDEDRANANVLVASTDLLTAAAPFDDALGEDDEFPDDTPVIMTWGRSTAHGVTLGDLRRLRAARCKAEGRS